MATTAVTTHRQPGTSAYSGDTQKISSIAGEEIFLRHGQGTYTYSNNFYTYKGEWKHGVKHGEGELLRSDGVVYRGTFLNGEATGYGLKKWPDTGATYAGEFLEGEMHGQGTFIRPPHDGKVSTGRTVVLGQMGRWLGGEHLEPAGDGSAQYHGSFMRNRRHGEGTLTIGGVGRYEGQFRNNVCHGYGIFKSDAGDVYEGYWERGVPHGRGKLALPRSGGIYVGSFVNGQAQGDHGQFKNDLLGISYNGPFTNGKMGILAVSARVRTEVDRALLEALHVAQVEREEEEKSKAVAALTAAKGDKGAFRGGNKLMTRKRHPEAAASRSRGEEKKSTRRRTKAEVSFVAVLLDRPDMLGHVLRRSDATLAADKSQSQPDYRFSVTSGHMKKDSPEIRNAAPPTGHEDKSVRRGTQQSVPVCDITSVIEVHRGEALPCMYVCVCDSQGQVVVAEQGRSWRISWHAAEDPAKEKKRKKSISAKAHCGGSLSSTAARAAFFCKCPPVGTNILEQAPQGLSKGKRTGQGARRAHRPNSPVSPPSSPRRGAGRKARSNACPYGRKPQCRGACEEQAKQEKPLDGKKSTSDDGDNDDGKASAAEKHGEAVAVATLVTGAAHNGYVLLDGSGDGAVVASHSDVGYYELAIQDMSNEVHCGADAGWPLGGIDVPRLPETRIGVRILGRSGGSFAARRRVDASKDQGQVKK